MMLRVFKLCRAAGFSLLLVQASSASAQVAEPIVGGSGFSPQVVPVAYIDGAIGSCTGILVGEREVLTAAHCVAALGAPAEVGITIAGETFAPNEAYYHAAYSEAAFVEDSAAYDIGIYLLPSPVTHIAPVPLLSGRRPRAGDRFATYGFGLTETAGSFGYSYGRSALVQVATATERTFAAREWGSNSFICSGDSGGPVMRSTGGMLALVGLTVAGTSWDFFEICLSSGDTESVFLDTQSDAATQFLAAFPGVRHINYTYQAIQLFARQLNDRLGAALSLTNAKKIKSVVNKQRDALKKNSYRGQGQRSTLLARVDAKLKKAASQKKAAPMKKYITAALQDLAALIALPLG